MVSPHFDDAVLSCAELIAGASGGSEVVTVFSGGPRKPGQISAWDRHCGFASGDDVMAARAAEDTAALSKLDATQRVLGFSQYRAVVPLWARTVLWRAIRHVRLQRGRDELATAIADRLAQELESRNPRTCAFPLGVSHDDHRLTSSACLKVADRLPELTWVVYEDMPYALEDAAGREAALAAIRSAGFAVEPVEPVEPVGLGEPVERGTNAAAVTKRAAVSCYASQLRGLGARAEAAITAPERYYLLRRAGAPTPASP